MICRHKLQPGDFQCRVDFRQWLTNRPPCFLENFIIGDEAGFAMNTPVNTHNVRDKAAVCIQRDGGMWKIKYE